MDYALSSPFGVAMQSALLTGRSPTDQTNTLRDDSPGFKLRKLESGDYGEKSLVDPMERKYNKQNNFMKIHTEGINSLSWNLAPTALPPKSKQSKFPDKKPGGLSIGLLGGGAGMDLGGIRSSS